MYDKVEVKLTPGLKWRSVMNVTVQDMMNARDRRAQRQRELLQKYAQTLLCFTMNIPGPEKDNPLFRQGFRLGQKLLRQGFLRLGISPLYASEELAVTGCEAYYVLPLSPLEVKRMATDIEEAAPVGRLFDLDVIRPDGQKVDRQEIGLPGRKCLICGKDARACARSRTHSLEELRNKTDGILAEAIRAEKAEIIARLACQSLLYEVLTTPKPGLVDRLHNGSHRDMDVFTFAASTSALYPYFHECAVIGMGLSENDPSAVFAALRLPGRMAEGKMLEATGGVNTHRGAIFSLGILCASAGWLSREEWHPDRLLEACGNMVQGLTAHDFDGMTKDSARTFGQMLFLEHGISGVRGEAEAGYPLVRLYGLPKLRETLAAGKSINDAGCAALIALIAHNTDTNVIHRGGLEWQQKLQAQAATLLARNLFPTFSDLETLDKALTAENISPGGSADLLAMCYLLTFLEEEAL